MKKTTILAAVSIAAAAQAADKTTDSFKLHFVEKATAPVVIDGKMDEADWKRAVPLTEFGCTTVSIDTRWKTPRTEFRCLWDDKYFYVLATCWEDTPENMKRFNDARNDRRRNFIWRDNVELHLDGNNDRHTKFQIWLNPTDEKEIIWYYDFGWGILADSNYGLNSDWDKAYTIGKDYWQVEARFALTHLEMKAKVGYIFGMEPARIRLWKTWYPKPGSGLPPDSTREAMAVLGWSTQGQTHHNAELYGKCVLVEKTPKNPVDGLRLAYPDLDRRTIYVQTDSEYVVVDHGRESRLSYLAKGKECIAGCGAKLKRLDDFVASITEPPRKGFFGDVLRRISSQRGEYETARSNVLAAAKLDIAAVSELERKNKAWDAAFENAYWECVRNLMRTEKKVRVPVKINPPADAPDKFAEEPERTPKPWERRNSEPTLFPWAKNLAERASGKTLVCAHQHGAWEAWALMNRLDVDADVFQCFDRGLGKTSDYFYEGLMLAPEKRKMLERMLKETPYEQFVFLGTSIDAWPMELQCWLYGRMLEGAKVVVVNGNNVFGREVEHEKELARGNPKGMVKLVRPEGGGRFDLEKSIDCRLPGVATAAFGKGSFACYNPGRAAGWCLTTLITPGWTLTPDIAYEDEYCLAAAARAVMTGLGMRGKRRCLEVGAPVQDGGTGAAATLTTAGPAWKGEVVWRVRDTFGRLLAGPDRLAVDLPAGTNHVTLAAPRLGAGRYTVDARLEAGGKLLDFASGELVIKPGKPVKCGCGGAYCRAEIAPPEFGEVRFSAGRGTFNPGEKIAVRAAVNGASAGGLKVRGDLRDVRNRVISRVEAAVDASADSVEIVFDQKFLDWSCNFIDVYLEGDRVFDVRRLTCFLHRGDAGADYRIFTTDPCGSGEFAELRLAYFQYCGIDLWETSDVRSCFRGGDPVIRDRIPGSTSDRGCSISSRWWLKHLERRYAEHAEQCRKINGRFISLGDDSGAPSVIQNTIPDWVPAYRERKAENLRRQGVKDFRLFGTDRDSVAKMVENLTPNELPTVVAAMRDAYDRVEVMNAHLNTKFADWKDVTLEAVKAAKPAESPQYVNFLFWLKKKYGTVDKLNAVWKTSVKDFLEIEQKLIEERQKDGVFAPAIDRQTYLEDAFVDQAAAIARGVCSRDRSIGFGFGASTLGNIKYDVLKHLNTVCPYAGSEDIQLARAVPHRYIGECIGVYGGKKVKRPIRERQVWHGLLDGCNFSWFWLGSYMVEGDGSVNPGRAGWMFATYREIMRGPVALTTRSKRENDGIRVLVSRNSGHLSPLVKEMSTHGQARGTLEGLVVAHGFQWDGISSEMIEKGDLRKGVKTLVLGYTQILSDKEIEEIISFVRNGGSVIADARIATHGVDGVRHAKPPLDELFGVKRLSPEAKVEHATLRVEGLAAAPVEIKGVLVDASLRASGAKAHARAASGAEAFFVREFGKGRAVLFNINMAAIPFLDGRGELGAANEAFRRVFAACGHRPFARAVADGVTVPAEFTRFTRDGAVCLGVEKSGRSCERFPMKAEVKLASTNWVYDIRAGRPVGRTDAIPVVFNGLDECFYALLPYEVKAVEVNAPDSAAKGSDLHVEAAVVAGDAGAKPVTHVLRFEMLPPEGESFERLAPVKFKLVDAKGGRASCDFRVAFNESVDRWKIVVTDVMTGVSSEKTVTVK